MVPISSALENQEDRYENVKGNMESLGFYVGGNWDYDSGSFDLSLDGKNMVWLRIPFTVKEGNFDPNMTYSNTVIRWGSPYVLKHIYQEGIDSTGESGLFSGMVNQFQEPVDEDAGVESHWIDKAKQIVKKLDTTII